MPSDDALPAFCSPEEWMEHHRPGWARECAIVKLLHEYEEEDPGFIRGLGGDLMEAVEICAHFDDELRTILADEVVPNWDHPSLRDHRPR